MPNGLTLYCNQRFGDAATRCLREGTAAHHLVHAPTADSSNLVAGQDDDLLANADVAFGQPAVRGVMRSARLRWVHLTTAGYERYATEGFRAAMKARGAILTTSSLVYSEPVAQHTLAMMLALARKLPASWEAQWTDRSWQYRPIRAQSVLLNGQTAVILGLGAIGRRLIELLAPFGMNLIAVRTAARGDEPVRTVPQAQVEWVLPLADHVISTLPGGDATRHFMNASRFAAMKPGAIFYNVGRGSTVDQESLLAGLRSGRLSAAYLDVMDPEPLPAEHPLWRAPNCYITPHTAGGHRDEQERIVSHFVQNLRRLVTGQPLMDRVM
jgi:phosphoglycerate dehydrogenase-like enzyme